MTEHDRFLKFKSAHRRMQVARHIETSHFKSNGHDAPKAGQETLHVVEHLPDQLPLWMRLREHFKKVFAVAVKKDDQGKYSISQPLALAILGFMLIFGATWYWRSSDTISQQHDEIIRLKTLLDSEKEKNIDQDSKIDQARNYATIADKNQARLEGKFDQFALQYGIRNGGKPPNGQ